MFLVILSGAGIALQSSYVQTILTQKFAEQLSERTNTNISIGKVDIAFFKRLILRDILVEGQNRDTLFYTEWASAKIDTLKIKNRRITFSEILFENNKINIVRDTANHFNFSFLIDSLKIKKDTSFYWHINCNQFGFLKSNLLYSDARSAHEQNIYLYDLNLNISDFNNRKDSVEFKINTLDLNDGENLFLEHFSADMVIGRDKVTASKINLQSKNSLIEDSNAIIYLNSDISPAHFNPEFDFNLTHSVISFNELSEIVPSLSGMDQKVELEGRIYGNVDDLKGKNILLKTGRTTEAVLDFYINGISDLETMYLFLDLKHAYTSFSDISSIRLPQNFNLRYLEFPESFYENDYLSYTGNFSGFLSDFVTFGTLESEMGILKTDVSVIPKEKETARFRGRLSTVEFKLGDLLQNTKLDKISFNGEVDGNFDTHDRTIAGVFKGDITQVDINNYTYRNIQLDGLYMDKMFDGLLSINDPNINFDFQGQINLNNTPEFNFNLKLNRFLPGKLNLSETFPKSEMSFNMKAQFTGNKIDNLRGVIYVENGFYKNKNNELALNKLQLVSIPSDSIESLSFTSDFFDVDVKGKYNYQSIVQTFRKIANHFIPAFSYTEQDVSKANLFDFQINVKEINELTRTFYPDLKFETPFLLYGNIDEANSDLQLSGSIPGIQYKNLWARNIFIGNKTIDNEYSSVFRFGEVLHQSGIEIYNLTINSKIADNISKNSISWNNKKDSAQYCLIQSRSTFSRSKNSDFPAINTKFVSSEVYIADSKWNFAPFNVTFDTSMVVINGFNVYHDNQNFMINGNISKQDSNRLELAFKNIDLGFLSKGLAAKNEYQGELNCSVNISNLFGNPVILSNIQIDSFKFEDYLVGDVNLNSYWDAEKTNIDTDLKIVKNNHLNLNATGYYNPDSGELNYNAVADSLSVKLLGTVIKKNFSNFEGYASGNVKIGGTTKKLEMNGALFASDAGLTIDYTQVAYKFSDLIYFKKDTILFDNITIRDIRNNEGKFKGTLVHSNFQDMIYNLSINSPKILAYNTQLRDNEQFYGEIYANCKLDVTGRGEKVTLAGSATTLKGTSVNISMDYEGDVEQYDFFEFRNFEEDSERQQFFTKKSNTDFNMNLTIEATPDAKVQLIYNSRIGDIIKAQGEGIILFEMDKDYNISLSGDYTLTSGDYLFTLQNVVNKRFIIEQGSSIIWSGDPYNAIINLTAIYKLKASLYDLMIENYLIEDIYQRIPVECKILLSEELTNPVINFEIDFPDEEEALIDILQQYINTEEEMNKQILSLIVLGKFYTPEYLRGTYEAQNPNTIGTTASEVFSNQLSNWLSQISNDVDIGFNYRPGNSITNDEIELALSTQIFNDRVTLNGNIGNNVNPESSNSSQIVGDFDIKVKLVPSGKIQFKAFNRSNNNLIYETAPYTQGIGLIFKEEYNSINELVQKMGSLFRRKD